MSNIKNLTIEDINEIMEAIETTSIEMYSSEFDEIKLALMKLVVDKKQAVDTNKEITGMTLIEAKDLAQQGIRVTHRYFTSDEYMIMKGNMIVFEDGAEIMFNDWVESKEYLKEGWSIFGAK
jgi:ribosomal protein L7/L12